ncbi:MAG: HEAT repeat domain-containing protein [Melioribacteraceae bacterium]|nr:HEAT repeat domain-containing protein [Melioribacteraceae bacterium]
MEKKEFEEMLQLYFAGELSEREEIILMEYIDNSPDAGAEFEEMKKLFAALDNMKPAIDFDTVLSQSRAGLMRSIRQEKLKPGIFESLLDNLKHFQLSGYKLAASSAFTLALGLVIGYFIFNPSLSRIAENSRSDVISVDEILASGLNIGNIRYSDDLNGDNRITVAFETVKPYSYTGTYGDEAIQRLLAAVITRSDNPGLKIQTVNKLSKKVDENIIPDRAIKAALITSLKTDDNAGVRMAAFEALKKYPYDEELRDTYLYVLSHDDNSGLRVSAINALAGLRFEGIELDQKVKRELKQKTEVERNQFIKNVAESLLRGEEL